MREEHWDTQSGLPLQATYHEKETLSRPLGIRHFGGNFTRTTKLAWVFCIACILYLAGSAMNGSSSALQDEKLGVGYGRPTELAHSSCPTFERKVYIIVPLNSFDPRACKALATWMLHGYHPILLNWGIESTNHMEKLRGLKRFLSESTTAPKELATPLSPECADTRGDIIVMADAFDVWAQQAEDAMISKFIKMDRKIVIGAEKNCFPDPTMNQWDNHVEWLLYAPCYEYPNSTLPENLYNGLVMEPRPVGRPRKRPQFLNTGTVIGYAKDLLVLMEAATDWSDNVASKQLGRPLRSDQGVVSRFYHQGNYSIDLDFKSETMQTMLWSHREVKLSTAFDEPNPPSPVLAGETAWYYRNLATGTVPSMLHFNMMDKSPLKSLVGTMFWGGSLGVEVQNRATSYLGSSHSYALLENGTRVPFMSMCQAEWPPSADESF